MSIYTKYVKALYDGNVLKIVYWAVSVDCTLYRVVWRGFTAGLWERHTKEHQILRWNTTKDKLLVVNKYIDRNVRFNNTLKKLLLQLKV